MYVTLLCILAKFNTMIRRQCCIYSSTMFTNASCPYRIQHTSHTIQHRLRSRLHHSRTKRLLSSRAVSTHSERLRYRRDGSNATLFSTDTLRNRAFNISPGGGVIQCDIRYAPLFTEPYHPCMNNEARPVHRPRLATIMRVP